MRNTVVVDLDDTLADMASLMVECLNYRTGRSLTKEDIRMYNVADIYGIDEATFYKFLERDGIIDELAVLPGVRNSLVRLSHDHEIVLVTARNKFRNPLARTLTWVRNRSLPIDRVIVSSGKKSEYIKDLGAIAFFDDALHNIHDVHTTGAADHLFIPAQPWNSNGHKSAIRQPTFRECVSRFYSRVNNEGADGAYSRGVS